MIPEGFTDYKRRTYCKDVSCPIQIELNTLDEGSESYERRRQICRTDCRHTTWEFHRWLIEKGFLIIKPE